MNYFILLTAQHLQINDTNGNNWSSMLVMIGQFFSLIMIFVVILFLAYYSTKWISKARIGGLRSNNMKVIESISVGMRASIQLIKVGEQYFLISVNKDVVAFLSEVRKDSIQEVFEDEKDEKIFGFEKYFKDSIEKYKNKKN